MDSNDSPADGYYGDSDLNDGEIDLSFLDDKANED